MNRRNFLRTSAMSVTSLTMLANLAANPGSLLGAERTPPDKLDQQTFDFWTNDVRRPSRAFAKGVSSKGAGGPEPAFVFHDEHSGFQTASDIDDKSLPASGPVNVSLRVERFRPSTLSQRTFVNVKSGSLRVDVTQTEALPSLQEVLAWTAVAAFVPDAQNKLPALQHLQFDPGQSWGRLQQIPLTNGLGFWSWNFFLKRNEGVWGEILGMFRQADKTVFPLLGLPAIALTALTAVDRLFAFFHAKGDSQWLLKSVDTPVYATTEAREKIGQGLPLKTGHYIVLPQDQLPTLGAARNSLDLKDGYIVPKGTDAFNWPSAALLQIPTVDYISLYVQVTKGR